MEFETLHLGGLTVEHAAGAGPKILFVHGAHAGSWYWADFMRHFSEAGFDCYAMNLRGHHPNPPSGAIGRVRLRDYVDDVLAVLEGVGEPAILVGHSLGGSLVQAAAARHPVLGVVMASAGPVAGVKFRRPPMTLSAFYHFMTTLPTLLRHQPLKPDFSVTRRSVLNRLPADQHRWFFENLGPESSVAALELLRGDIQGDLSELDIPKLVISGTSDKAVLIEMQRDIAEAQAADLIELMGHGHVFMIEPGWQRCARRIEQWLEDHRISAQSKPESVQYAAL